jgi:hypothetical protein
MNYDFCVKALRVKYKNTKNTFTSRRSIKLKHWRQKLSLPFVGGISGWQRVILANKLYIKIKSEI